MSALSKAKEIKARLDETASDPKWLNEDLDALIGLLEAGEPAAPASGDLQKSVAALAHNVGQAATMQFSGKGLSVAPRDPNHVALAILLYSDQTAYDVAGVNAAWDAAETFIAVSKTRREAWVAAQAAAATSGT
jgi:hypothetical protein